VSGGPSIWIAGLCGSVLANAAIVAVLAVAMRPEQVTQQQSPQTELDVQAVQLKRDHAAEQTPAPESAIAARPDSPMMDPGRIPRSEAVPGSSRPDRVSARPPPRDPLSATRPSAPAQVPADAASTRLESLTTWAVMAAERPLSANPVRAAQVLSTDALPNELPEDIDLAPAKVRPAMLDAAPKLSLPAPEGTSRPVPIRENAAQDMQTSLAQIDLPDAGTLDRVPIQPAALGSSEKSAMPLPEVSGAPVALSLETAASEPAPPAPKNATRMKAALAFSGAARGEIDPVSLAAFQSFVRPGDMPEQGGGVRDAVSELLAQVPCSRLQVEFDPQTTSLQVKGHIPEDGLRTPILRALQLQMGDDINVSDNILILPRPQCGALSGISEVGLPQSTDQITNPMLIGADTHVRELDFVKDDRLFFDLTAPDYGSYVYVDYFDADGNVLHLSPNAHVPLRKMAAKSVFRVGARTPEGDGLQILIGPPYGQEIAAAFAASVPLHDGSRPLIEPAAPYLDWLKSQVAKARAEHPDFKGEWVYFFVRTSER
jgi:hypothetical protein